MRETQKRKNIINITEATNKLESLNIVEPIIELSNNQTDITEACYKVMRNCFVCNFGYNVEDTITHSKALEILKNEGMIQNFVTSGDLKLL